MFVWKKHFGYGLFGRVDYTVLNSIKEEKEAKISSIAMLSTV